MPSPPALSRIFTDEERRPPEELYRVPRWYACLTRARHEKKVDALLRGAGLESYLPVAASVRQWRDRKKVVAWPLFPGYIFARFTLGDVHRVLATHGVATIVRAGGYPTPIPEEELENVRRFAEALAASGEAADPVPFLEEGRRVRIVDGPFQGVEGIVVEARGRRRVRVGLAAIRQGLEVDVARSILEPL